MIGPQRTQDAGKTGMRYNALSATENRLHGRYNPKDTSLTSSRSFG
jgi:hypothetical protein